MPFVKTEDANLPLPPALKRVPAPARAYPDVPEESDRCCPFPPWPQAATATHQPPPLPQLHPCPSLRPPPRPSSFFQPSPPPTSSSSTLLLMASSQPAPTPSPVDFSLSSSSELPSLSSSSSSPSLSSLAAQQPQPGLRLAPLNFTTQPNMMLTHNISVCLFSID